MRLLFLSNFYPPHGHGGYEQWCREVAEGLTARGHEIVVLTSRHGTPGDSGDRSLRISRRLHLEMDIASWQNAFLFFFDRRRREHANLAQVQHWVDEFEPDAIMIWGMWNLPRSLPALAERLYPGRTTYYLGDYWPTLPSQWWNYWQAPARNRLGHLPKRLLRSQAKRFLEIEATPALRFPHALFPSEFMCRAYEQAAVQIGQARIVLGGVDTGAFSCVANQRIPSSPELPLRLLVAGRLLEAKGIHTAIGALAILTHEHGRRDVELTVAGTGEPAHVSSLQRLAQTLGVDNRVQFVGLVPQEDMPNVYCSHDVFVFPSIWAEPFGRVLVEAMAARLAVVGTTVGGAGEILHDGETGLTFPPEDSVRLAAQILRLADDRDLRCRLARQGQTFALARFDIGRMTAAIEQYLQEVVRRA